ncbi:hypothetical protein Droror1_Dr00010927, partial [Drosera rotundifolia]
MSCRGCDREGHNKRGCRHKDEKDAYAAALVAQKIASAEKKATRAKKDTRAKENAASTQQVNHDTASLDDAASLGSAFLSTFGISQITLTS